MTSKPNSKESAQSGPLHTNPANDPRLNIYERQHHAHRHAERLTAFSRHPGLSPRAAAAARQLAKLAHEVRALIDHHVIKMHFPEDTRHRDYAHALLAQLRRDGTDTPERVERVLGLANGLAHEIEAIKREWMMNHQVLRMPLTPHFAHRIRLFFSEPGRRAP